MQQVSGPAAGEDVVATRAPVLLAFQRDQFAQQGRVALTDQNFDLAELCRHAAPSAFLVLEVFAERLSARCIPGLIATLVTNGGAEALARNSIRLTAHPAVDAEAGRTEQIRRFGQRRPKRNGTDDPVVVVHRRRDGQNGRAAFLIGEIADHLPVSPEHSQGAARADPRRDLRELDAEIRAGQIRIGGDPRRPLRALARRQACEIANINSQCADHKSPFARNEQQFPFRFALLALARFDTVESHGERPMTQALPADLDLSQSGERAFRPQRQNGPPDCSGRPPCYALLGPPRLRAA
ncbi:hypothetical protein D3C85_1182920 [compost metagenome]